MPELNITDDAEQALVLSALISHCNKCRDTIKLHEETKAALDKSSSRTAASVAAPRRIIHSPLAGWQ